MYLVQDTNTCISGFTLKLGSISFPSPQFLLINMLVVCPQPETVVRALINWRAWLYHVHLHVHVRHDHIYPKLVVCDDTILPCFRPLIQISPLVESLGARLASNLIATLTSLFALSPECVVEAPSLQVYPSLLLYGSLHDYRILPKQVPTPQVHNSMTW